MADAMLQPTADVADPLEGSEHLVVSEDSGPSRNWWYIVGTIIVVSAIAHLWKLGLRPLAHDEAIDARFSWQARNFGVMEYDPVYHGPLRFYIEGVVLRFFGTGPGWTRLVAALAGIASTALIATSHRMLGRIGAPVAALLFTVSPTVLTVTRTGREDSLTGLVSLAMLLIVADALRTRPTHRHAIATGALLATSFTIKETTFIFGFAGACFVAGLAVFAWRRDAQARQFLIALKGLGRSTLLWTVVAFLAVFMFVFTSAFRYAGGFESGLLDGIRYWLSQHDVGRGSQRWFFYLTILAAYEWLTLALAAVGLVVAVRTKSMVGLWFATMAFVQLTVYSWAGEKFAWLALHPMIPLVLLAGLGAEHLARRSMAASADSKVSPLLIGAVAIAMVGTARRWRFGRPSLPATTHANSWSPCKPGRACPKSPKNSVRARRPGWLTTSSSTNATAGHGRGPGTCTAFVTSATSRSIQPSPSRRVTTRTSCRHRPTRRPFPTDSPSNGLRSVAGGFPTTAT